MIEDMKIKAWSRTNKAFLEDSHFKKLGSICLDFISIENIKKGVMIYEEEDINYVVNFGLKDKNGRLIYGGDYIIVRKDNVEYEQLMPFDINNYVKDCYILSSNEYEIEYSRNFYETSNLRFLS